MNKDNDIESLRSDRHDGCTRAFSHLSAAWYASSVQDRESVDEIMVGMYDLTGGGTTGEFAIRWIKLGNEQSPRLEVFNDAWNSLWHFQDLLRAMADIDGKHSSPGEIASVLQGLGIVDITQRVRPGTTTDGTKPRLDEIEFSRGLWKIRGVVVAPESGQEAMRAALSEIKTNE